MIFLQANLFLDINLKVIQENAAEKKKHATLNDLITMQIK